jgi:7,8-dihydro-6-hydroxymethylpterin-pyrophosphokinase
MEKTVKTVILALGSNLGNRSENIEQAINRIQNEIGKVIAKADFIETEPFEMESSDVFLNVFGDLFSAVSFELFEKLIFALFLLAFFFSFLLYGY